MGCGRLSTLFRANCGGAEFTHDLPRCPDRGCVLIHIERDGTYAGVSAAAVAFADLRQVYYRFLGSPWVGPDRHLHAEAALAKSHAIDRFGMKIVRNELVVAFEILIGDVEKNCAVFAFGALPQNLNRDFVAS